jgi:diacylglycerol diphosphate phosphatase / phosphatidate phosphatase
MIYWVQLYDQVTGDVICHGEKNFLQDGRKSFPSGHTSRKFAVISGHRL